MQRESSGHGIGGDATPTSNSIKMTSGRRADLPVFAVIKCQSTRNLFPFSAMFAEIYEWQVGNLSKATTAKAWKILRKYFIISSPWTLI